MGINQISNLTPIISTEDAKDHLRLDTADDDAYVAGLVLAATDWLEQMTNLALTPREFSLTLDQWPDSGTIIVPRPPLVSVDIIRINGTTLATSNYTADTSATPGRLIAIGTIPTPTAPAGIVIEFSAGYETAPPALIHAAKLLVGGWFLNREAAQDRTVSNLPSAIALESIINTYRIPFAGGFEV